MKNKILFPRNCRLDDKLRPKLKAGLDGIPMNISCKNPKKDDAIVYPSLIFVSGSNHSREITGSQLIPKIDSDSYTVEFDDKYIGPTITGMGLGGPAVGHRTFTYRMWAPRLVGELMFVESSCDPERYPTLSYSTGSSYLHLAIPARKLFGVDGKPIFRDPKIE